jgi:hypothetical protein
LYGEIITVFRKSNHSYIIPEKKLRFSVNLLHKSIEYLPSCERIRKGKIYSLENNSALQPFRNTAPGCALNIANVSGNIAGFIFSAEFGGNFVRNILPFNKP